MWKIYFCKLFYITNLFIVSRPAYCKFNEIKKQKSKKKCKKILKKWLSREETFIKEKLSSMQQNCKQRKKVSDRSSYPL